jgi:hypothetical protein
MPRGRPHKCPYEGCGSTSTVSKGARKTKFMGLRKIRLCKSCGRKFTPRNQRLIQTEPAKGEVTSIAGPEDPAITDTETHEPREIRLPGQ